MRTTLDLDDVALDAAKGLASVEGRSIGKVVGDLVLEALRNRSSKPLSHRNGIPLLPRQGGELVTEELIQRIKDEEGL